ncbi:MAG: TonB-dependent receptor plug domain-containing protein, partial [Myxococcota bacterium]
YRLIVPVPNYRKLRKRVNVRRGVPLRLQVYLTPTNAGLFQGVTRVRRKKLEIHQQSLQEEEIRIAPGTQGDPLKVVQNLPGVARTPLNTGAFIVRGSAPDASDVYLDGHQIPLLYHFGGLTAVVNGDMAKQLDFIPGGFSVAYGRATGGIIHLRTRAGKERFHGYVDLDVIDVGLFLEGPLWKGATFIASFRRSHLDLFLNLILPPTRAFDLTVAPRYYDFQFKIDWNVAQGHRLTLMYFGAGDKLSFLREEPVGRSSSLRGEFFFRTSFHRVNFAWTYRQGKTLEHDFLIQTGFNDLVVSGGAQLGIETWTPLVSFRDELRWKPLKWLFVRTGVDLTLIAYP